MSVPRTFRSTRPGGLDHDGTAWRLWEKAKRLGVWNPRDIDLARDAEDWRLLREDERDVLLRLAALFVAGEEAVTVDLLPLIAAIAAEGRLEEEMYLTSFLFEEAKHVEAFDRFFTEVAGERSDLSRYHTDAYRAIFSDALPAAIARLAHDRSPCAQAEAVATYNMIVEGVLAETGYHGYHTVLDRAGIMPGMAQLVGLIKRDESRHIAYGVHLLTRLVAEHGDDAWEVAQQRMSELLPHALGVIGELFGAYEAMPFGLDPDVFVSFAMTQFSGRMAAIERALDSSAH